MSMIATVNVNNDDETSTSERTSDNNMVNTNNTIVTVNNELAKGNNQRAKAEFSKQCRAYLASEIAYAVANGYNNICISMDYGIDYTSPVQWRVNLDDNNDINTSNPHVITEIGKAFDNNDSLGIVRWLANKAGITHALIASNNEYSYSAKSINIIVDNKVVNDNDLESVADNDNTGMKLILGWRN